MKMAAAMVFVLLLAFCSHARAQYPTPLDLTGTFSFQYGGTPPRAAINLSGRIHNPRSTPSGEMYLVLEAQGLPGAAFEGITTVAYGPRLPSLPPGGSHVDISHVNLPPYNTPPPGAYTIHLRLFVNDPDLPPGTFRHNATLTLPGYHRIPTESPATTVQANLSDLWWNPNESGWGITLADHETDMFAVWYTYKADGSPTWFVVPGGTFTENRRRFSGDAYQTTGPAYDAPYSSRPVTVTRVGSVSFDFAPPGLAAGAALFTYNINGVSGTKQIERQPFGNAPANWGTDLTDLWWNPAESGWGFSINQHGTNVFAIWYTYDAAGQPLFIVMPGATFAGSTTFTGDLYTTRGPYFGGPFSSSQVQVIPFGDATIDFSGTTAAMQQSLAKIWNPRTGKLKIRPRPGSGSQPFNKVIKQQRYGYDAPATPPVSCTPSYGAWSPCQADGFRYRTLASTACPAASVDFEACSPQQPVACTSHAYSEWSTCQNGVRTRTVLSSSPPGCSGGVAPGPLSEACTVTPPACTSHTYSNWSACQNGSRSRFLVSSSPPGCVGGLTPGPLSESCSGTPPQEGTCRGTGTITLAGRLRDPGQPFCQGGFNNFPPQPITISIGMANWNSTAPQLAQVFIDKGTWICSQDQPRAVGQYFLPTLTLARSGSGYTATGSGQDSAGNFTIGFTLAGGNASGSISRTYRQSDADWRFEGTFSCSL